MGNLFSQQLPPPELCLIPPQIKQQRPRPFTRSQFDLFGRAVRELVVDFFPDDNNLEVNLMMQPDLPDDLLAPSEIQSYGRVHIGLEKNVPNFGGGLAIDSYWHNALFRAAAKVEVDKRHPAIAAFSVEKRTVSGMRFMGEISPSGRVGFSGGYYGNILTYGVIANDFYNVKTEKKSPIVEGWVTLALPGLHLGLRAPYDINTRTIGKADLALTIRTTNTSNVEDRPPFEITALIRQMGQSFTFSYFQHFVVRRRIYNPFEEKHVKQIVNYIDVGTIVDVQDDGHTNLSIAASWQLNKNHMIKAKVDNRRASLAYVFKSWFHPALSLSIAGKYDYATMRPSLGFILNLQTSSTADFERAGDDFTKKVTLYKAEEAPAYRRYEVVSKNEPLQPQQPQQSK